MATRSDRLANGVIATGISQTLFLVPQGLTVIVKTIYGYAGPAATARFLLQWVTDGTKTTFAIVGPASDNSWRWEGWLVLDPGYGLAIQNLSGGTIYYYVSGAKLPGVAADLPALLPADTGADTSAVA